MEKIEMTFYVYFILHGVSLPCIYSIRTEISSNSEFFFSTVLVEVIFGYESKFMKTEPTASFI